MKLYRPHILVVIALGVVLSTGWHAALRNALTDQRFAWQQRQASGDIVVVGIDAPSIAEIGVWPWPRRLHADLLRQLERAGVKDVAFDVDFSTPSDAASDQEFLEALTDVGGSTVLPSFKQPVVGRKDFINEPLKPFKNQSWPSVVNVEVEPDGLVRRYPFGEKLNGRFLPSMSSVLAGEYIERSMPFLIDFGIRMASIPQVSFVDVLRGKGDVLESLKDKKVIVGATALELGDRVSIPNGGIASGPLLQAIAAESILQHRALRWTSGSVALLLLCAIAGLMAAMWKRTGPGLRVVILIAASAIVELIAIVVQFKWPLVIDTSLFHVATIAYIAATALDEIDFRGLLGRVAERRFQRIAMSLGEGLICTDHDHHITFWNPGAEAMFGYPPAEVIGKPINLICASRTDDALFLKIAPGKPDSPAPAGTVVEFAGRRSDGASFAVEACLSAWHGTNGLQYGAILRDITVRKREAERIRYLAEYDSLTGLANRNTLQSGLTAMIAAHEQSSIALLVLGLDSFMNINDLHGHAVGDSVLQGVAKRLKEEARDEGLVARLSGDEFAIAMPLSALPHTVETFAERTLAAFERPMSAGPSEYRVKISTGIAVYPENGRNASDLLSNGHLAFCRAKGPRRGGHVMFTNSMRQELEARVALEADLARAVECNEFELFYQPQVRLADGLLCGAEALIRWRHPERGLVPPIQFMPVVNSSAISDKIATWVMLTACRQARQWELAGHPIRVGINLSPSQLQSGDLAMSVTDVLQATGLSSGLLELEVTEDILLTDEERVLDIFARIQRLGVRLVFDDFGTGFASLSYLKKFPLDGLKIDRSFVRDLLTESDDAAIVGSTIGLSKQLNLSVIAEGIEDSATAELLMKMGCLEGQGYFFGKPMPVVDLNRVWLQLEAA